MFVHPMLTASNLQATGNCITTNDIIDYVHNQQQRNKSIPVNIKSWLTWIVFWNSSRRSACHLEVLVTWCFPRTRTQTATDLPPAPASWAVPMNENITWPRLLDEKPKHCEEFQSTIQCESKFIHFKWILDPITLFVNSFQLQHALYTGYTVNKSAKQGSKFVFFGSKCYHVFSFATGILMW